MCELTNQEIMDCQAKGTARTCDDNSKRITKAAVEEYKQHHRDITSEKLINQIAHEIWLEDSGLPEVWIEFENHYKEIADQILSLATPVIIEQYKKRVREGIEETRTKNPYMDKGGCFDWQVVEPAMHDAYDESLTKAKEVIEEVE